MATSVRWGDHTAEDLASAVELNSLVILPLGCTEQHAWHLPVDTDTYQVQRLAHEGAARAAAEHGTPVLVLPTLPYGPAAEHFGLPGTIDVPNEVYLPLLTSILRSVIRLGFRRLIVLRGCGGHWVVPGALWDLKAETETSGVPVVIRQLDVAEGWAALQEKHLADGGSGHAAAMETALALAERAELVRLERAPAPRTQRLRERYSDGGEIFLFREMSDTGALGAASPATPEAGRAIWDSLIDAFAAKLTALDALDRELGRR